MKIGIISLGLIGGSLFKCLSKTEHTIYAVTRNSETIAKAKKYSQFVSDDINILKECDVIFVASPMNKVLETLDMLENVVNENCIVLDCSSVKEFVMKKERPYKFIGSHPMAGTQFSGFDAAFKELFEGAKWVLTPSNSTKEEDLETIEKIILKTGAQPIICDAKEHDYAAALISHMPLLISQAIFKTAKDNKLALKLASSGFRDMTRLSTSNLDMAMDMRKYNQENIDEAVNKFNEELKFLNNTKDLEIYVDIKNTRSSMYSNEGKNIF